MKTKNLITVLLLKLKFLFITCGRLLPILIFVCFLSCGEQSEIAPPNIVWITSEDNSKHYLKLFDEKGVETPNIKSLADHGLIFTRAFSNAPVCSVARSTIISGCYAPRVGSQYHRKQQMVPMPEGLQMFPAYLKQAGYFTSNNAKEDYNFIKSDDVWDDSSKDATWRNAAEGQPFFHVFNIHTTHESRLHFTATEMDSIPTSTAQTASHVQPNHPDTPTFRYTNAFYRDKIKEMDKQVGEVLAQLKEDGMLENTFIFYYGDHGGVLPGSKGYLYETGLHVPLVVHIPEKYTHLAPAEKGSALSGTVSFVDLAPTVLKLAGIDIPKEMDGVPFLGKGVSKSNVDEREITYGYADRFDEKYDMVRTVRKGNFKYFRNYQGFNPDALFNRYRYHQLAYAKWLDLYKKGALNDKQAAFFVARPPEMLFNLETDPYETQNLADDPEHQMILEELRGEVQDWISGMPDLSFYPEHFLVRNAFDNPVSFGKAHQREIDNYINIADLSLSGFDEIKQELEATLNAEDPWARYWGLIVCSTFGNKAMELAPKIKEMAQNDSELVNQVRAAEFLGLVKAESPVDIMTRALYDSQDESEALLILNSIMLMQDFETDYVFELSKDKLFPSLMENNHIQWRMSVFAP